MCLTNEDRETIQTNVANTSVVANKF